MRRLLSLLLFIPLSLLPAQSQELTVKSFSMSTNDIIPTNEQRADLNGDACALVKIQIVDAIDRIEGNVIGDVVDRGVEKWVFMTQGSKEIRIFPKHHLPLTVNCSDYGINGLERKRVYVLRLTSDQTINEQVAEVTQEVQKETKDEPVAEQMIETVPEPTPQPTYYYTPTKQEHDSDNKIAFGIRGGLNMASTQFSKEYDKVSMVASFHLGVSLDVPFSEHFYLNTALLFSNKGYKYDKVETATAQYIDLPIMASLRFGDIDATQFQINAGPYVAFGIGGKIESENGSTNEDFFSYYNSFDYGLSIGAALLFSRHFYIGGNFQLGMADYRNRNISASIGYNF